MRRKKRHVWRWVLSGVFGIALLVGGGALLIHHANSYASIDTERPVRRLKTDLKAENGTTYVVIHKAGCKACQEAESTIVPRVRSLQGANRNVIVIDTAKLSAKQKAQLKDVLPDAFVGNKVPTPQVLQITPSNERYFWVTQAQTSKFVMDRSEIRQLLSINPASKE